MARKLYQDLDFQNASKILNLPDPTTNQEPATKAYVDSATEGLAWKDSVRVATQGNINLNSPGASIDGVTMTSGDRVLVKAQTAANENGIYIFNSAATVMTRSADANSASKLEQAITSVEEGTNAGSSFRQSTVNFTLNSGSVVWGQFGTTSPTATETNSGIAEIATQAEVNTGTDDIRIVTPAKLKNWSNAPKKFAQDFGDGSATQFDFTHNFGTRDVTVTVYRTVSPYDEIICDVSHLDINTIRLNFGIIPTTNQFRIVING